jgi:hypothetical protein
MERMIEGDDFVLVKQVRLVPANGLSKTLIGNFVGTKAYLYFFPSRFFSNGKDSVDFRYKNESLEKVVLEKLNDKKGTDQTFYAFVQQKLKSKIQEIVVIDLKTLPQFKVYRTFWGSGILINETENKTGWKPFVSRFKKDKYKVEAFYTQMSNKTK